MGRRTPRKILLCLKAPDTPATGPAPCKYGAAGPGGKGPVL